MKLNIDKDLLREREKCTFDIQELIHIIDGGKDKTLMRKSIENLVLSVEELKDEVPEDYLSHAEKYENAIRKGCILFDLHSYLTKNNTKLDNSMTISSFEELLIKIAPRLQKQFVFRKPVDPMEMLGLSIRPSNVYRIHEGILKQVYPFLLHSALFMPTIMNQASEEQKAKWLKKNSKMIGTYALTELGHGSFLRGLETTATFDPEKDEFIINSPAITSYKYWPGGLGHTANAAVVMAQLYIKENCLGTHIFLVQIRDFETHKPLPGIKVGEIGPKMGFNTADNGFLGFNNVRIPRENMLMKNAQVLRDGTYIKSKNAKHTYGSMVMIRARVISDIAYEVARAVTIAVRYSAVRHQSLLKEGAPEPQVLDYVTQQHKLFISIASSHAYRVVGQWVWNRYTKISAQIGEGNLSELPELHALTCCLKAVCTRDGLALVESCRLACGGHGYLLSSNLPNLYSIVAANVTYEGEHTIVLLQTARFLAKAWNGAMNGKKLPPTVAFLADYCNKNVQHWSDSSKGIVEGFKAIAAGKLKAACDSIQAHLNRGRQFEDAWNLCSIQLITASEAFARYLLCDIFWKETQNVVKSVSENLAVVLRQFVELYLVYWALEKRGDLLMYTTISKDNIELMQTRYEELLGLIRPNSVPLVDAFDIRDEILCSTLGSYDGRVYERLMEDASKSPLNKQDVHDSFYKYTKPLMMKHKL